jgi:hypothetical protein
MPWNEEQDKIQLLPPSPKPRIGRWIRIFALVLIAFSLAWGCLTVEATQALLGLPGCTPDDIASMIFQRLISGPGPLFVLGAGAYVAYRKTGRPR